MSVLADSTPVRVSHRRGVVAVRAIRRLRVLWLSIVAPAEVFQDLPRRPTEFLMVGAVVAVLCAIPVTALLQTGFGQQVIAREQRRTITQAAHRLTPVQIDRIERSGAEQRRSWPTRMGIMTATGLMMSLFLFAVGIYVISAIKIGPQATLTDVLAISVACSGVFVVEYLFVTVINIFADAYHMRANVQLLIPWMNLEGRSSLWTLAEMCDPFAVLWLLVVALGLRTYYGQRYIGWAAILLSCYVGLALTFLLIHPEGLSFSLRHAGR